ncbi:MAG: 50S ribosomal protein L18 [Eubacteriales bacterium]|jgi:large subunit ribosomal protein L18|nr:50S ribosomal protein L18 [Eubacteriales bacterium]MCI6979710.1 50S ribosomal protein L18 [Clostridiales bacterium]HZK44977.1 50S ribosomal protein L18 [Clostridia bacterium]MDD6722001.1 50S ribosomal protein L18 [Clostridiales bacterium]MDD6839337.1 50S ribosomal protein L18 [Clostridiales bacterium]
MISRIDKNSVRKKRHQRTRRHILGTAERPRLNVYRSLNHIYAQVIDDNASHTLAAASTLDAELSAQLEGKSKSEAAELVGELVAKRAIEKGVKQVVFDRGGYLYTGRVQKLADGARKAGLEF